MNKRLWIVLIILVVAAFGGMVWYKNNNDKEAKTLASYADNLNGSKLITKDDIIKAKEKAMGRSLDDSEKEDIIDDHYLGKTDAKVTVIEYEDFACSHCQAFHTYAEQIQDDYKDRVLFIFRDFSLGYPNSAATLAAGEAVKKLGGNDAFWKMSKQLFKDQAWISQGVPPEQRKELFNQYVKELGVNTDDFNKLLDNYQNNGIQDKIDRDKALGKKAGVAGTPTWLINGKKVDSVNDSSVRQAIDDALKEADK